MPTVGAIHEGCAAWSYSNGGVEMHFGEEMPCPVQASTPEDFAGKTFTDFQTMVDEISAHTRATGDTVFNYDMSTGDKYMIGFLTLPKNNKGAKGWFILATDLEASLKRMEAEPDDPKALLLRASPRIKAQLLRHCLKTQDGRQRLLMAFPRPKA